MNPSLQGSGGWGANLTTPQSWSGNLTGSFGPSNNSGQYVQPASPWSGLYVQPSTPWAGQALQPTQSHNQAQPAGPDPQALGISTWYSQNAPVAQAQAAARDAQLELERAGQAPWQLAGSMGTGSSGLGFPTWGTGAGGDTGSGGGGQNLTPAPATDAKRVADLQAGFRTQNDAMKSSFGLAQQQGADNYNQGILNYLDQLRSGQNTINRQGVQNELSRSQGYRGILDMVGQGIKSGGVMLANKNAGNSSASEALARAYQSLGTRQNSNNINQYSQGQNAIDQAQSDLSVSSTASKRNLDFGKQQAVTSFVDNVQRQLSALDAAMVNANIPDRINIEQEKEQIKQDFLGTLAKYDAVLNQGISGVSQTTPDERRIEGQRLAGISTSPNSPFEFLDTPASQFESNRSDNGLPLFTFPGSRRRQLA